MSRRIEVELTSDRGDGTWTWRAAGARQPKGVLPADVLYPGAKVGDVVRAEADFDVDGITVLSVQAPRGARAEPERLELLGPARPFEPVISNVTGRDREGGERPRRPRREGGGDRERGDRGDRDRDRDRDRRPSGPRSAPGDRRPRPEGRAERAERPARPPRERPAPPPPKPKAKKLRPGRVHRDALLASLPPEQQAVAEQVIRGGMPAVRAALEEQNSAARAEGRPEVPTEVLLSMAEAVLPQARVAEWLDRAEAALADADELALRDLRSVVVSADDVARDESTRALAAQLREVLERRTGAEQEAWLADLTSSLEGGRVVRALRLSSRPPEPTSTLPSELTTRLAEAAGTAMTADIAPDRWATVLDAVAYSPVRRAVTPAGMPAEPDGELLAAVRKHAGRVPAIAALFGVSPPTPSGAGAGARRSRPGRSGPRPARATVPAAPAGVPAGPPLPPGIRRIPPPPGMVRGRIPPPPGSHVPAAPAASVDAATADASAPHEVSAAEVGPGAVADAEATPSEAPASDASVPREVSAPEAPAEDAFTPKELSAPEARTVSVPPEVPAAEASSTADAPAPDRPASQETQPEAVPPEGVPAPAHADGTSAPLDIEPVPDPSAPTGPNLPPEPAGSFPPEDAPEPQADVSTPPPADASPTEVAAPLGVGPVPDPGAPTGPNLPPGPAGSFPAESALTDGPESDATAGDAAASGDEPADEPGIPPAPPAPPGGG